MSKLVEHAKFELEKAGYFDTDGMYGGMVGESVLELVEAFAEQGHSGLSASLALRVFARVADWEPLLPLTGEDDEWNEVGGVFQNKRCSHVFKDTSHGQAYDSSGKVFRDSDGCCFTSLDSRVPVTFPYTPTAEYVDVR